MTTETILAGDHMEDIWDEVNAEYGREIFRCSHYDFAHAIEQAVLQSIANDPDRINAAAKALSKHQDYPWEFMAAEGRDSMRTAAMVTINAAMEKQP